jgi:glycyl-tRNA synthetase beta chain
LKLDLDEAIATSTDIAEKDVKRSPSMLDDPRRFIFERFQFYTGTHYIKRDDVIAAVCKTAYAHDSLDLVDILERMKALESVTTKPDFNPLIVGFKRAHRLVEKEQWDRKPVDEARFEHPTEVALYQAMKREMTMSAMTRGEYGQALDGLVRLKPAIDAFFEAVMVNAEDPAVRNNRLSLLQDIDDFFNSFADFSQIVVQGS